MKILTLIFFLVGIQAQADQTQISSFHQIAKVEMGGKGGWDDLSVDSDHQRLYVSHSDRVVVVDTKTNLVLKEITDTPGVHGIALGKDLGKAFSSDGKENEVAVIDMNTLAIKGKIKVGENPDAIVYEPLHHEVYVFNGKSRSVSIIDGKKETVSATLPLRGKPEFATVDSEHGRVFVNIEDRNEIVGIDIDTHKVVSTWPLEGCESPSGMAIDTKNRRLFSVCENEKMVMVDSTSGKVLSSVKTGSGSDGAGFDPILGLVFSPNGKSGTLTVVQEVLPDQLALQENVTTQVGARTMCLDPKTHQIYTPTADFNPAKTGERPKPIDGSQRILVFGR